MKELSTEQKELNAELFLKNRAPYILSKLKKLNPRNYPYVLERIEAENFKNLEAVSSTFLWGKSGTFKTTSILFLVYCWAAHRYINGVTKIDFVFINLQELLAQFRNSYNPNSPIKESDLVEQFCGCSLLVIDDFEAEKTSDWAYKQVYRIVEYRHTNFKTTLYTCNYNLNMIAELLDDDRITRRIYEDCKNNIIEL